MGAGWAAQRGFKVGTGHRAREQITLPVVAAHGRQQIALLGGFHPFGHHLHAQGVGHGHHGFAQGQFGGVRCQVAHKRLVDFDEVDGKTLQVRQRRVAGTKVVQRCLDACGGRFQQAIADPAAGVQAAGLR